MSQQQRSPWLPMVVVTGFLVLPLGAQGPRQTDADHYTRYELLAPGSAKFRIIYEVTATTAGARQYFNPIRRGSVATDEAVYDRMTGKALPWRVVNGRIAAAGGVRGADSTGEYIAIDLARPVPANGEARLLIDKTYEDARSYLAGGDTLVFTRGLGIKKNSVVLPAGYEVVSANYPSQVRQEADGRLQLSFMNIGPAEVPYVVKARRIGAGGAPPLHKVPRVRPPTAILPLRVVAHPPHRHPPPPPPPNPIPRATRGSVNARARTGRSSTSSSRPKRAPSTSTTTTPNRGRASVATSTSCAPGAASRIRPPTSSTPVNPRPSAPCAAPRSPTPRSTLADRSRANPRWW